MSRVPSFSLDALYEAGLRAHLSDAGEDSLTLAYELGRRALSEGIGIVELASAHARALALLPNASADASAAFFAEAATPFEMALSGFREANEQLRGLNADLTSKNAELVRAREAAEAAARELEQFTGSVSHDLQGPVRRMRSFAGVLEQDHAAHLDADAKATIARIRVSAERMTQLINDLLRLAKLAKNELILEPCDVSALARTILRRLADAEPTRVVTTKIADGIVTRADRSLLQIALENLLGNAWKFTSKTANAVIEVGVNTGELYVSDNGAGFDPTYAHKLFIPFQRLHSEASFEGTGIGLATVGRIVRRHGGRVVGSGEPGRGATFRLTFSPSEP